MSAAARTTVGDGPVVFVHAHPDDEAIFTGGTIAALADAGRDVVVVFCTDGSAATAPPGVDLAALRRREASAAAQILGVSELVFWPYADSGMDPGSAPAEAFSTEPLEGPTGRLCELVASCGASAVVSYDSAGVYGHPDHVRAHDVTAAAAATTGVPFHQVTVDREYLHFVDTHLLGVATGLAPSAGAWGVPTVEVTSTADVRRWLPAKVAAIAAHASQVDPALLADAVVGDVYGYEWYIDPPGTGPLLSV